MTALECGRVRQYRLILRPVRRYRDNTLAGIHDNVGVALNWFVDARRPTDALTLLRALSPLWQDDGWRPRWVWPRRRRTRGPTGWPPPCMRRLLMFGGVNALASGYLEVARRRLSASIKLWRTLGDHVGFWRRRVSSRAARTDESANGATASWPTRL